MQAFSESATSPPSSRLQSKPNVQTCIQRDYPPTASPATIQPLQDLNLRYRLIPSTWPQSEPPPRFIVGDIAVLRPFNVVDRYGRTIEFALPVTRVDWRDGEWVYAWESTTPSGSPLGAFFYDDISRRPLFRRGDRVTLAGWTAGSCVGYIVGYEIDYAQHPDDHPNVGRLYYLVEWEWEQFAHHDLLRF